MAKKRPHETESEIWLGQNNADYGLLIALRFANGHWENDISEIRAFKLKYWTIGHVLATGFVIPDNKDKKPFASIDDYLLFFKNTLVRYSGSPYEKAIAEWYCDYVARSENPLDIPLLIPEFRFDGIKRKHRYRLDFLVIDPYTMDKVGIELSPWSSHGNMTGLKDLNSKQINEKASQNFSKV